MKTTYIKITLLLLSLLTSCNKIELEELNQSSNVKSRKMHIFTRTSDSDQLTFPLHLYAFDVKNNQLKEALTITSSEDNSTMNLATGNYHVVALSGIENITTEITDINNSVNMPSSNYSLQPVRLGSADIVITKDANITLTLWNKVAAIDLTLSDIPENATQVTVGFSLLNNQIQLNGSTSGQAVATIELNHQGNNIWKADRFYTLPNSNNMLNMSITIITSDGQSTYSFSHPTPLEENTPYIINGSYEKGFSLNNQIEVGEWKNTKTIDFKFGNQTSSGSTPPTTDDNNTAQVDSITYWVNSFPEEGEFWNNHIVALVEYPFAEEACNILLLSKKEWKNVPSAYSETPDSALTIANSYVEEDLNNWRIPTKIEAQKMWDEIGGDLYLETTNSTLEQRELPILATGPESGSTQIRYLCEDAQSSFTWDDYKFGAIKCGASRTYRLRAVKSIKLKLK